MKTRISDIGKVVSKMGKRERSLFERFFEVGVFDARLVVPKTMEAWVKKHFKSKNAVERQRIISVKNKITLEHALFNPLRSMRPLPGGKEKVESEKINCMFCEPWKNTPSDTFGRVEGKYCLTASNVAKYDLFHAVVIQKEHSLTLENAGEERMRDFLAVAEKWFAKTEERGASEHFFLWNHGHRSGASIKHEHMQVTSSKIKYGKVERLEKVCEEYEKTFGSSYLKDFKRVHGYLGLLRGDKVFHLVPKKNNEILIIKEGESLVEISRELSEVVKFYLVARVESFNVAAFKLGNFCIAKIVDRGSEARINSDIGAMELYAASVISSDPFVLARRFEKLSHG